MTAVFSVTWQAFRLGLQVAPSGRSALSTLRTRVGFSTHFGEPSQQLRTVHWATLSTKVLLNSKDNRRSTTNIGAIVSPFRKQFRWASLWEPSSEPKGGEEDAAEYVIHEDEIKKIFGEQMNAEEGAEVLMALQTRRFEGTLDKKMKYSDQWIAKGLAYLRHRFPMDEEAAIIARIDREIANGVRAPQTDIDQSPSAVSQFDRFQRENKKKAAERQRKEEEEEEEEKRMNQEGNLATKEMRAYETSIPAIRRDRKAEPEWVRKYREQTEQMELPPNVTTTQRLLPSGLLVVTVLTLSLLFAKYYKPPTRMARLFPDVPPAAATVLTIMAANFLVALMWRLPPLWPFMNTAFIVYPTYPYAKAMLGASFSHHQVMHLLVNMYILWALGTRVHDDVGRGPFLAIYFASAVLGAYIPMVAYVLTNNLGTGTVGASACLAALLATSCVLHEGQIIRIAGIPDVFTQGFDSGFFLFLFMLGELLGMYRVGLKVPQTVPGSPAQHRADHMGHLTGLAVGVVAGIIIRLRDPKWRDVRREHWYTDLFKVYGEEPPDP